MVKGALALEKMEEIIVVFIKIDNPTGGMVNCPRMNTLRNILLQKIDLFKDKINKTVIKEICHQMTYLISGNFTGTPNAF